MAARGVYDRPWRNIAGMIRADVAAGNLRPGDRLPTTAELAERYPDNGKVRAKNTIRSALDQLIADGVIEMRGRSYYVRDGDLGRQLQLNEERAAFDTLRGAYDAVITLIKGLDDLHTALAIVARLVPTLQGLLDGATDVRRDIVERIYEQDALVLKPLADQLSVSKARADREGC